MNEKYPLTVFHSDKPVIIQNKQEWEDFAHHFTLIHAAGGIVSNENDEILMIFRYGCWDFPKGKVEAGEDWKTAAVREVEEETGLHDIRISRPYPNTYHTYTLHDTPILKITHWYEMRAPKQSLTPQTEEDISKAVWVARDAVSDHLRESYASLKGFWEEVR